MEKLKKLASGSSLRRAKMGLEDGEEFDEAMMPAALFCKPITVEEFEDQAEKETEKAIDELLGYLDSHKDEYSGMLKKKKRQDLESAGVLSYVKVKMFDFIHGENSPLVRVTDEERDRHLLELKRNMIKAFDYSQETKGRRMSKRLAEKRLRAAQDPNSTPSRVVQSKSPGRRAKPSPLWVKAKDTAPGGPMPPPPPPPPPPFIAGSTPKTKIEGRKPFTPLENRLNQVNSPSNNTQKKPKEDYDDILGSTPNLNCSLTSLHQELLSSNPWKRLKCANENRSPCGTPTRTKTTSEPLEPLHRALYNKFKNVRPVSPSDTLDTTVTSPVNFSP